MMSLVVFSKIRFQPASLLDQALDWSSRSRIYQLEAIIKVSRRILLISGAIMLELMMKLLPKYASRAFSMLRGCGSKPFSRYNVRLHRHVTT